MPSATLVAPARTSGNFNAIVSFGTPFEGFDKTDVNLVALSGNGVKGVDFDIIGEGANYNIQFRLPDDVRGSLRIELTGQVRPVGGGEFEAITANPRTVVYDNISSVAASFGQPEYRANREIAVPINFPENVQYFSKTDCDPKRVSGDVIYDFDYYLIGENSIFHLVLVPPPDKSGSLMVGISGHIYKTASFVRDNIVIKPILIPYDTTIPYLVDYQSPGELYPGTWDIFLEFNAPVLGIGIKDFTPEVPMARGTFLYEGESPSTAVLYRANSLDVKPELPPEPADRDNPPACVGDWTLDDTGDSRISAKYFLLRFNVPQNQSGAFFVTPIFEGIRAGF